MAAAAACALAVSGFVCAVRHHSREARSASGGPEFAASLDALLGQRRFADAEALARARLGQLEESGAGDSLEAANTIDLFLRAAWNGANARAEYTPLAERARAIKIREARSDTPEFAVTLNNLANQRILAGDYRGAEPLYRQALDVRQKTLPPNDPDIARSLNNLATISTILGRYSDAVAWHRKNLAAIERSLGPEHRDVAVVLNNLSEVLVLLGDYEAARALHERMRTIQEKHPRDEFDTDLAGTLALLGDDLNVLGDSAGAIAMYERALPIWIGAHGPVHETVAGGLQGLGRVLFDSGDLAGARARLDAACAMHEQLLPPDHPDLATCLILKADVLAGSGDLREAKPLYERAIRIRETVYGTGHPRAIDGQLGLARVLAAVGEPDRAFALALQAEADARHHFQTTASLLSAREALRYERVRASGLDCVLSLLARRNGPTARDVERAWDTIVRSRALVLDEMIARRRVMHADAGPRVFERARDLDAARNRLAHAVTVESAGDHELARLQEDRDTAERALAEESAAFEKSLTERRVGFEAVRASLPPASALVAYARYGDATQGGTRPLGVPWYGAFVLSVGGRAWFVPLGPAATVDRLVAAWRREVASPPRGLSSSLGDADGRYLAAAEPLRAIVWDKVATHLSGAEQIFIVPDGVLNLVSFAALPSPGGGYLAERGPLLHELSTERELARPRAERGAAGRVLVFGAPDFGGEAVPRRFRPIPASLVEAREVAQLAGRPDRVVLLVGRDADEAAFKRLAPGSRTLHLATHGFFSGDPGATVRRAAWDEPLLLSGLALAGANLAPARGSRRGKRDRSRGRRSSGRGDRGL